MEDIKELQSAPNGGHSETRYKDPNRDRALGEADRTGRHFDEGADGSLDEVTPEEEDEQQ